MKKIRVKVCIFFQKGQMLVELVLIIGLSAILLPALLFGVIASREGGPQQVENLNATELFKQTANAVKEISNTNWNSFAMDGTFHPVVSNNNWTLVAGTTTVNGFTQEVDIGDVYRDSDGTIVSSGGTLDPSTKEVVIKISWSQPYAEQLDATMYLTRINNVTYVESLTTDFNKGTATGTSVLATSGSSLSNDGQVQLASGGGAGGDWCKPAQNVVATYDLPGQGVATSISATSSATQNFAYTTTGGNASGDSVDALTITHAFPPVVSNPSSNNEAKAYGIFGDNLNNYVYFNENNPPGYSVRILQGTTLASAGFFNASGGGTGSSIYVKGNTGYTTVGSKLYSFDVTTMKGTSSQTQLGSVSLAGNGKRVFVVGTNAYVVTDSTTSQLQIINVSNPASMSVTKSINLGNSQAGVDVYVNGSQTYAYVVTTYGSGKNDFFIVDLTNTSNIWGYQTINSMNPKGIAVVSGNRAILVGSGGEQYEVFDITTPSAVTHCGGMSPSGVTTINAVAPILQNDGIAYAYIVTDNSSAEFQVILGGSGGQFSSSGTFESQTFDTSSVSGSTFTSSFNKFVATVAQPVATTLQMQVAAAAAINGSCTGVTYTYVGPNGNTSSYFTPTNGTISALVPLGSYGATYQNPGRCFRYKLWFSSSDTSQTPVLYDMTLNYSL